jgi:orotate phosphoribosyltransferase
MTTSISRTDLAHRIVAASKISGTFVLRSGAVSNTYFDKYRFEAQPELLAAIADHLAELVPSGTGRLIGLEMGGIPLATAVSLQTGIKAGFCRKKPKEYGTRLQIEGGVEAGEKVTIIEDVITSGGAAIDAIHALRGSGIEILALLGVVDRESGGAEKFKELGVDFRPLFTWSQLNELTGGK